MHAAGYLYLSVEAAQRPIEFGPKVTLGPTRYRTRHSASKQHQACRRSSNDHSLATREIPCSGILMHMPGTAYARQDKIGVSGI